MNKHLPVLIWFFIKKLSVTNVEHFNSIYNVEYQLIHKIKSQPTFEQMNYFEHKNKI